MSIINTKPSNIGHDDMLVYMKRDMIFFVFLFALFVVGMIVLAVIDQRTGFLTSWASMLLTRLGVSL